MAWRVAVRYLHMTVAENMSFGLRMAHRPKAEIDAKVAKATQILQPEPLLQCKPAALSDGQRQRVAIGREIVRDPLVFLFDEPLSNLDAELWVQTRVEARVEIAKLYQALGNSIIYVTHDQTEAMTLADKIVVPQTGKIEQVGIPMDLYNDPDNAFVAGFIGSPRMSFLKVVVADCGLKLGDVVAPLPQLSTRRTTGETLQLGIRPDIDRVWFRVRRNCWHVSGMPRRPRHGDAESRLGCPYPLFRHRAVLRDRAVGTAAGQVSGG